MIKGRRLLIFHKAIAPYRIDFFNSLNEVFEMRICPFSDHMTSQPFNHEKLSVDFQFEPFYLIKKWNLGFIKVPRGIFKQIKSFAPDLIFVNEFGLVTILVILYKIIFFKKYQVVSICDDSYNMIADNNDFKWKHRFARKVVTPLLNDLVLVDPQVVEWYQLHFKKGIFFPIIRNERIARDAYKAALPLTEGFIKQYEVDNLNVFLFVGRLVRLKNVDTILNAFINLDQTKNVLIIVGEGPERECLESLAQKINVHALFVGRKEGDNLNILYNIADCCILASLQEAFGAVTNEALLAGCWCLVSNRAGSKCLIEKGKNGFTFDPTDVDDLASFMKESTNHFICKNQGLRENRMKYKYDELFNQLIDRLDYLFKHEPKEVN